MTLSPTSVGLAGPGDTATVAASVLDEGGSEIVSPTLMWSSDDEGIATVSGTGLVTAVASGSAVITAEVSGDSQPVTEALTVTIDDGALSGPGGGQVTAADGAVTLVFPAGALAELVFITAEPATGLPVEPPPIPGTAFDFGPDGIVFGQPVTLTVSYDPTDLPAGVPADELRLYKVVNGEYVLVEGSTVDVASHTVSGLIQGFSVYAILRRLRVTTSSLPDGVENIDYGTRALTVAGGVGSYLWSIGSGSLPTGMTLATNGVISGTPMVAGTFDFTVQVRSGHQTAQRVLSITVHPVLAVTTTTLGLGVTGAPYNESLTATGGDGDYVWAVTAGTLPSGLSLNASSGVISGTPGVPGTSNFAVQVTSGGQTAQRTLAIAVNATLQVTTTALANGVPTVPYAGTLTATGGGGSHSWTLVAGSLPAGLSLATSGDITGTPTATGTSNFTVEVTSADGQNNQQALSITVTNSLSVFTATLPDGVVNVDYGTETLVATGGNGNYSWSVVSGSLPQGLGLSVAGVITGTPTVLGTSNFTVEVTSGDAQSAQQALSITVVPVLEVSTTALPDAIENDAYVEPLIATGGNGSYSWALASGSLPTGLSVAANGDINGIPTVPGISNFTVEVNSDGQTAQRALAITVHATLVVTTTSLPDGVEDVDYGTETLTGTGGDGSYSWSLASGSLPTGLSLSTSGDVTGTPTVPGTSTFTAGVTEGTQVAQQVMSITVNATLMVTTTSLPDGVENEAYSETLIATGGTGSFSWTLASGSLPTGLTLATNGHITGTPTVTGVANFTVEVTDGVQIAQRALMITVPGLPTTVTDLAIVGQTPTTLTVQFTEGDNGIGGPADYTIRHAVSPIAWGDAHSTEMVVAGTQVGVQRQVTITGLSLATQYDVQLVSFRGTLNQDAVFSSLSNIATGTTLPAQVLLPTELCSAYPDYAIATFEDPALESHVRNGLEVAAEDDLTCALVRTLRGIYPEPANVSSLNGLQNLIGLEKLSLGGRTLRDLGPISGLTGLSTLALRFVGDIDLGPLIGLTHLTSLSISNNEITDLGPISGLTNLTSLSLSESFALEDISPLSGLVDLTFLSLDRARQITDLSPLAGLTNLTTLSIYGSDSSDFGPLSGLVSLALIDLGFSAITDLSPLSGLLHLETIVLVESAITNIDPLLDPSGFVSLTSVDLLSTTVSCSDIAALQARGVGVGSDCGELIVFRSDRDEGWGMEVFSMRPDGRSVENRTNNVATDFQPALSTRLSKIAFASNRFGNLDIFVMNTISGASAIRLTNDPSSDMSPAWSPDGSQIAFESTRGEGGVFVMDADGSDVTRLADGFWPSWSPGTRIAFGSTRDGNAEIYVMDSDGSNQTRLTYNGAIDQRPSWSPDGSKIVFESRRDGDAEIYVMNSDGTEQTRLTTIGANYLPSWSPDGSKIVFSSSRDGNREIYVMDADGSNQTRLTDNSAIDDWPVWGFVRY